MIGGALVGWVGRWSDGEEQWVIGGSGRDGWGAVVMGRYSRR